MNIADFKSFYFEEIKIVHEGKSYWPEEFLAEITLKLEPLTSFNWGSNSPDFDDKKFARHKVKDLYSNLDVTCFKNKENLFFFFLDDDGNVLFSVKPAKVVEEYTLEKILSIKGLVDISQGNREISDLIQNFSKIASLILKVVEDRGEAKFSPAYPRLRKVYNNFVSSIAKTDQFKSNGLKAERVGLDGWRISKE